MYERLYVLTDSSMSLCVQDELTTFIGRVLEEAKQNWTKGEEPTREDGCFVSPVAYDIIQVPSIRRIQNNVKPM